ncbi:MAG: tetratricopeptide repeat protein [Pseudomonadota bacterium]
MTKLFHAALLTPLILALTGAPLDSFPAPAGREEALADLEHAATERRAEAVVWIANHGAAGDQALLLKRLRDESPFVRGFAEQGLWLLWSRSGDAGIDRLMARGTDEMHAGRYAEAVSVFTRIIKAKPEFAEGWNRRATVHFLAGDYQRSLADCDEVLKRNPRHFGALSGYGQIYFRLGEYEKALEWWRRALQVNPNMLGVEVNIKETERLLEQKRRRAI